MSFKISLIGAGNIGGSLAHILARKTYCNEIVLFDINEGTAKGKALDIRQSGSIFGNGGSLIGTSNYQDIANSDVIIITAGIPRKPGMSRDDLLKTNASIIASVAENVKKYSPNSFVIVITNPLDIIVKHFQDVSGIDAKKVVGMAGVLDTARFKCFLADALNVFAGDISSFVLGGHGDTMVPMLSCTNIAGVPLSQFIKKGLITQDKVEAIIKRTREGGAEIVSLLGNGSAFYSPAESAVIMAESYLLNQKKILPCAAKLNGEYGVKDLYAGVPCKIGSNGVESIIEVELDEGEKAMFASSILAVKSLEEALKAILA
jgi:malate dehydrogenase